MISNNTDVLNKHQGAVLQAFSRALNREAHVLTQHPDLLWQQMYNRLQWEGEEVELRLAPQLEKRSTSGHKPWLKMNTPYAESITLIASLSEKGRKKDAAFSADGSVLLCWETVRDISMKRAFNAHTGAEIAPTDIPTVARPGRWSGGSFTSWDRRFRIEVEDTTPKLLVTIAEGLFKISYHNFRNRITLAFWDHGNDKKLSEASLWSIDVFPDGRRHNDGVYTCAFSPDGRHVVTSLISRNRSVHIWDMKTGRLKRRLANRDYGVTACGFSPDGRKIVTAGFDDREGAWLLRVWDLRSGRCTQTFRGHAGGWRDKIEFCEYSPDGQRIVSGGEEQTLMLWDASETTRPVELPNHAATVTGCAFSADGKWVLSAGGSTLYIRDAVSGVVLNCWVHPQKPGKKLLQDCAVSSDKHWIATTIEMSKPLNPYETWTHVCIWNAASGRRVHKLDSSKTLPIVHTTYSKPEKPTRHFILHCGGFHPDSKTLITVGGGNYYQNVVIWDAKSGQPLRTLAGYIKGQTVALRYSRDGRWIAAAYNASRKLGQMEYFGNVEVWDATTGAKSAAVSMETGEVRCCGFSPDSTRIVYVSDDGRLFLWNREDEQPELALQGHTGAVNFCGFTPDGRCIVSAGADRVIRVWNLEGEPVAALPFPQDVVTGDLHPAKAVFALGDNTGFVHLFELMEMR